MRCLQASARPALARGARMLLPGGLQQPLTTQRVRVVPNAASSTVTTSVRPPAVPQVSSELFPKDAPQQRQASTVAIEGPMEVPPPSGQTVAELDAQKFALDPTVPKWSDPNDPYTLRNKGSLQEVVSKIAAAATQDGPSAVYWSYHYARFGFFLTQAVGGLLSHAAAERLKADPSVTPTKMQELPFSRLFSNFGPEFINRAFECFGVWEQDHAWVRAGVFKLPWDMTAVTPRNPQWNPLNIASRSVRFWQEASATLQRRVRGKPDKVWLTTPFAPQYYNGHTFHFQTDGWMSDWSANVYEHSTETLFSGRQDAMQRTSLVPMSEYIANSQVPASSMRLLEVAAGTGRLHTFVKDNWPEMRSVVSDLSPFYLQKARDNMKEWKSLRQPNLWLGGTDGTGVDYLQAAAENLQGVADESFDIVLCVYLFHEMPEPARRKAAAEWFRVLKPGGLLVFTDSVQQGDRPEFDSSIGNFSLFNEPHYNGYLKCDLGALFSDVGFVPGTKLLSSTTKTLSFTKPGTVASPSASPFVNPEETAAPTPASA